MNDGLEWERAVGSERRVGNNFRLYPLSFSGGITVNPDATMGQESQPDAARLG